MSRSPSGSASFAARTIGSGSQEPAELFVARLSTAQGIEADPADDHRQPASNVIAPARVAAVEPQPGFLDGVLGLGDRSKHPVADRAQVTAVALELRGEPVASGQVIARVRDRHGWNTDRRRQR